MANPPRTEMSIWDMVANVKAQADKAGEDAAMRQVMSPPIDERQTMLPSNFNDVLNPLSLDQLEFMHKDRAAHGGTPGAFIRANVVPPSQKDEMLKQALMKVKGQ